MQPVSACGAAQHLGEAARPARGSWQPVVLVHGIMSGLDLWEPQGGRASTSIHDALVTLPNVAVYGFDYSKYSLDWVTNSHIGPALASSIDCLAAASGRGVIVVAHSMGGLATQWAQAQPAPHSGGTIGDHLSLVVTIGTPTLGSQLDRLASVLTDPAAVLIAPALAGFLRSCGVLGTRRPTGPNCGVFSVLDTAAGRAMRPGSPELAALPGWNPAIEVHRIAGDLHFTESVGRRVVADVPVGDVVVSRDS